MARGLLADATPMLLSAAGLTLCYAVDVAALGAAGDAALAACGLGTAAFLPVVLLGTGLMTGFDGPIAQSVAVERPGRARVFAWRAAALAAGLTLPIVLLGAALPSLWRAGGIEPGLIADATDLVLVRALGVPAQLFAVPLSTLLVALRRRRLLAAIHVASVGLALLLDPLLVLGTEPGSPLASAGVLLSVAPLGAMGMGLATSACLWATCLAMAAAAWTTSQGSPAEAPRSSLAQDLRAAAREGLPASVHGALDAAGYAALAMLAARLGTAAAALHEVALTWFSAGSALCVAFARAAALRTAAQVFGAGALARQAIRTASALSLGTVAALALGTWLVVPHVVTAFAAPGPWTRFFDALPLLALALAADALLLIGVRVLRMLGRGSAAATLSLTGTWLVALPLAAVAARFSALPSVATLWAALAGGLACAALITLRAASAAAARGPTALFVSGPHRRPS